MCALLILVDISEEYSDTYSSENECKMAKIKAKEQFDFGNNSCIVEAHMDLDQLERLVITPKERQRVEEGDTERQ